MKRSRLSRRFFAYVRFRPEALASRGQYFTCWSKASLVHFLRTLDPEGIEQVRIRLGECDENYIIARRGAVWEAYIIEDMGPVFLEEIADLEALVKFVEDLGC